MKNTVIVDAIRTSMGRSKPGSLFTEMHPTELLAQTFKALIERNNIDPSTVDNVITGCVSQVGEQSGTPGRVAWAKELGVSDERLNPWGGAIALGHPLGASGARLMTTMINALQTTGGRYGLQTMCEAGGMADAMIIERL